MFPLPRRFTPPVVPPLERESTSLMKMQLNRSTVPFPARLPSTALCLLTSFLLLPASLLAGDKLNIGGSKTQEQPGQTEQVKRTLTLDQLNKADLRGSIPSQALGRERERSLSKFEKRLRNERDERKNWALLEPGQLQSEEMSDEDFGIRNYDLQRRDNEMGERDYTFFGLDKEETAGGTRQDQGSLSRNGERRRLTTPGRSGPGNNEPGTLRSPRSTTSPDGNIAMGAHVSEDLNLSDLLDTTSSELGPNRNLLQSQPRASLTAGFGQTKTLSFQEERMSNFRQLIGVNSADQTKDDPLAPAAPPTSLSPLNQNLRGNLHSQAFNSGPQLPLYTAPNRNLPNRAFNLPETPSSLNALAPLRNPFDQPTRLSPAPGPRENLPGPSGWEPPRRRF